MLNNSDKQFIISEVVKWIQEFVDDHSVTEFDNFLDIGGHSLMALALDERVQRAFGQGLDRGDLFEKQIIDAIRPVLNIDHLPFALQEDHKPYINNLKYGLSADEKEQFDRDGFIGPITIYTPEEMEERWKVIRRALPDRSHAVYPSDTLGSVTNISNYDRHLDIDLLSEHICNPKIVDKVASILGHDVLCWRSEFFPKYPGDEGTDWHQADTFANASGKPQILWPGETELRFGAGTITVWTAFTDATLENGCLQLIPGSHNKMNYNENGGMTYSPGNVNAINKDGTNRGFFGYDYRELQIDSDWKPDESLAYPVVMKRGECLIFWSTLMHASLPHTGEKTDYRMGFAARYVPTSVKIYPNTSTVEEYGGSIPLDNYGAVLVSGKDSYGHNKLISVNRRGYRFNIEEY